MRGGGYTGYLGMAFESSGATLSACFIVGTFSSSSSDFKRGIVERERKREQQQHLPQKEDLRQFNVADKIFMKACRFIDHLQLLLKKLSMLTLFTAPPLSRHVQRCFMTLSLRAIARSKMLPHNFCK